MALSMRRVKGKLIGLEELDPERTPDVGKNGWCGGLGDCPTYLLTLPWAICFSYRGDADVWR